MMSMRLEAPGMSSGGRVYVAGESPRRRVYKVRSFCARYRRKNVRYRFTDTDHMHTHTTTRATRRALQGGVLDDDADDDASAAPVARAPAARLCAARAVQVVELEGPVGGARGERGTTRGRCRVAAATAAVGKRKSLEEEPWAAPAVARSPIVRNLPALRVESM